MNENEKQRHQPLHSVFWRLHFWSGLLTAPIVLCAVLSGMLYIFVPQIEAWQYAALDQAGSRAPARDLDTQLAAAALAAPGHALNMVVPAYAPGSSSQFYFSPNNAHTAHLPGSAHQHAAAEDRLIVYVDPGNAQVLGQLKESRRFRNWARKLHSSLLQGDSWRWLTEAAASTMLMMTLTGLWLWWPRTGRGWRGILRPPVSSSAGGRRAQWRYWHSISSVVLGLVTCTILLTGLTWSKYAGDHFRVMQTALAQNSPRAPAHLHSLAGAEQNRLSLQDIYTRARQSAPAVSLQMSPPKDARGVWRIENNDRSQPAKRCQLVLDAYSGALLFQSGWEQMPFLSKATAIGIPFHRGEFGWWNQALLVLVALSVLFSVCSGYVMWLQRRKPASLSAPRMAWHHVRAVPVWLWLLMLTLGLALPVLGISLLVLLLLEALALAAGRIRAV